MCCRRSAAVRPRRSNSAKSRFIDAVRRIPSTSLILPNRSRPRTYPLRSLPGEGRLLLIDHLTIFDLQLHLERDYSALAPENLTTLAHLSVSSAISRAKSAGEPANGVPPIWASRVRIC